MPCRWLDGIPGRRELTIRASRIRAAFGANGCRTIPSSTGSKTETDPPLD
jgi:hypothetical protein